MHTRSPGDTSSLVLRAARARVAVFCAALLIAGAPSQSRAQANAAGSLAALDRDTILPGRPYPVNAIFEVTVPNGHVRSAVARSNREGTGVVPHVDVAAADALRTAHCLL